jgi:hypothetical protein
VIITKIALEGPDVGSTGRAKDVLMDFEFGLVGRH